MHFKETVLITKVDWIKGLKKTATVTAKKTGKTKEELKTYVFKTFEEDGLKLEKMLFNIVVADFYVLQSNSGFSSEILIKNPIRLDLPKVSDNERIYDKNHY